MVQPPKSQTDIVEFQRFMRERARIEGLPSDLLVILESMELLADQGNPVAATLYMALCDRHNINFAKRFKVPA